mgnify:CR=1 FL=1
MSVTPAGFEDYEAAALGIVEQALAEDVRSDLDCTPVDAAALARKKDRDDSAATTAARADALARAEAMERKERSAASRGGATARGRRRRARGT